MLVNQVRAFCEKYHLFVPGTTVVVAVSGGPDSLALLRLLIDLQPKLGIDVYVATLDHQIRGAASAADVQFVQDMAGTWGGPIITRSNNLTTFARKQGRRSEEAAPLDRYILLSQTGHKHYCHD